ncbi:MAG: sterol desaturase family protein [Pseudomonadota bacterium]
MEQLQQIALGVLYALNMVAGDPNSRVYVAYLAAGAGLALLVGGREELRRGLLDADIWTSRSARIDYVSFFVTPVIAALGWTALVLNGEAVAGWASGAFDGFAALELPGAMTALVATLVLFLAHDLSVYVAHWLMHRVPPLWEFHKLHHSAERLNVFTAYRTHPVETLVAASVGALIVGGANGALFAALGPETAPATLLGANAVWIVANLAGGSLRHSEVWLSFGPRLERWFISPAMHQIHHSEAERHWDKNLGAALAVWDRMFGTLYVPKGREEIVYGVGDETQAYQSVSGAYVRPFLRAASTLVPRSRKRPVRSPA